MDIWRDEWVFREMNEFFPRKVSLEELELRLSTFEIERNGNGSYMRK